MKNLIFISCILIILFKTGNVLSSNDIFNVNNIEIKKEIYKNRENLTNQAFLKGFDKLISRLLLENDYKRLSDVNLKQIKTLSSHYQILSPENTDKESENLKVNIFFDKDRIHNLFYNNKILYSDIVNTEVILFPLLIKEKKHFIYSKNFFYENWITDSDNLIQYTLPVENIENIQKINSSKDNIFELDILDLFKEYKIENMVFANIEIKKDTAQVFLNTRIGIKKINKKLSAIEKNELNEKKFYNKIILEINKVIKDLIKSENLIDVRTPSFLNVKIKLNNKSNLVEINNRLNQISLIDDFYVQQLNRDYVLVKIKYLGKIKKIINKLKNQNINLKMKQGEWELNLI